MTDLQPSGEVTRLLHELQAGDRGALDRLFPLVYDELRASARRALARERDAHVIQATELVHEAFFKLAGGAPIALQGRAHFFAVASRAMRQVLVEQARKRLADKRGGGVDHVTLGDSDAALDVVPEELVALDEALERLGQLEPRLRSVVEYRFFGGLSEREVAEVIGVTERTVQRDWVKARAWLYKELYPSEEPA